MNEKISNIESEYHFNENIQIIKGLYNGYYGKIKFFNGKHYDVKITIDGRESTIVCKVEDLRKVKKLGLFGI